MKWTSRILAAGVGLIALSALANSVVQSRVARADDRPNPTAARIKQLEDKIAALEASQQKLLERLHDLEFPELRRRDANEIRVLKLRVDAAKTEWDRVAKAQAAKAIGGENVYLLTAAYHLSSARAQLAWAERDIRDAVRHTAAATWYAEERVREHHIIWRLPPSAGRGFPFRDFHNAMEAQAHARMALLRAIAVAKSAKTDVSDVKIEIASIKDNTTEVKSLTDALRFLRESAADDSSSTKKE